MLAGSKRKRNPKYARTQYLIEKTQCFILTGLLTPGFYLLQLVVVKVSVFHYILSVYCFINIVGNMFLSIFTDTTVKSYKGEGEYCEICKQKQPAMSWHCPTCNACMKRSDHHCFFLSHCVGRSNYRYFVLFLGHLAFSMLYSTVWYIVMLWSSFYSGMFLAPARLTSPARFSPRTEDIYVVCLFFDMILFLFAACLFIFHIRNVLRGVTSYEYVKRKPYVKRHWKTNVVYAFGTRWYWAVLWPFVSSPLPDDEILSEKESNDKISSLDL